jgi:hypothetical protein
MYVTITDDDSHIASESQTLPADESAESAGTCHCFPQRVSVVRAFGAQRQHCEVVSKQWHAQCSKLARINVHRSLETNKCARCGVHAEQFRNERAFLSTSHLHTAGRSVRSYTHKRARLSRTARAGLGSLSPTSRHLGPHRSPISAATCVWAKVSNPGGEAAGTTQPALKPRLLSWVGSVPVTLLGERALSKGNAPAYYINELMNFKKVNLFSLLIIIN